MNEMPIGQVLSIKRKTTPIHGYCCGCAALITEPLFFIVYVPNNGFKGVYGSTIGTQALACNNDCLTYWLFKAGLA